jgi:AcrR family transcriptional regulator
MKVSATRSYRMGRRAEAAEHTRRRILDAAAELFMAAYFADVTLEQVAGKAGVTLQTVLRRFESKEGLYRAVVEYAGPRLAVDRDQVAPGDIAHAVNRVVETLEIYGDATMRLRHQSEQIAVLAEVTQHGHQWHRQWVARIFGGLVHCRDAREKRRRLAAIAAATDVYSWRLLRRDYGLSKAHAKRTMLMQVTALTNMFANTKA